MKERGFTLVELLVVVTVIGIISAIAVSAYIGTTRKATRTEAFSNLNSLRLLQEQFFAENGRYTASVGAAGNSLAIATANILAIQTTANEALPGFRPGAGGSYSYRTIQNVALNLPTTPWNGVTVAQTPCFVAVATGLVNTRVGPPDPGDIFVIDCNNNKNF